MTQTHYRYVGRHLADLADGTLLEPGRTYRLDDDQARLPHNQRLLEQGLLIESAAAVKAAHHTTKKERD